MSLRVYKKDNTLPDIGGLEPKDARAAFKNVSVDMRQFKKLRMFLHAEALEADATGDRLANDEMVAFLRFGNDFTENFYQVEIPLKVTDLSARSAEDIWPADNEIELPLELLTKLKIMALQNTLPPDDDLNDGIQFANESFLGSSSSKLTLGIKGNPNFGLVRTLMVGVKNKNSAEPIRGEVWFNELRMSDIGQQRRLGSHSQYGYEFCGLCQCFGNGRKSTIGFGSLEQGPNERSREDVFQYDVVTNVNLGKLLPKKWGITLPFNYAVGEEVITPKFDPYYQDIELQQILDITQD